MREKKIRANQTRKKDKHQVHCVGLHSAEHTHTHTNRSSSKKKWQKEKKNLAAEHRAVRQVEERERERRKKT